MPATQRGQVDAIAAKKWRLRWYTRDGRRRSKQPFPSKSAAWKWFREEVEPSLAPGSAGKPDLPLSEFVGLFLTRRSGALRARTIQTLTERLRHAERVFGQVPLSELEGMVDEIAGWHAAQPSGAAYGRMSAFRQLLGEAVRWGHMESNPAEKTGRNRQPPPRSVRVFSGAELQLISRELSPRHRSLPAFVAATGLRPEEWQALRHSDIDWKRRILSVRRTVSLIRHHACDGKQCQTEAGCRGHSAVVELAKTSNSRRQVPLSSQALAALEEMPRRLDLPLLFPSPSGERLNLNNFRNREWNPAIEASGVERPARVYDLRSTFASTALAAGVTIFELARIMGNSVEMVERHYGTLLDGSAASIASRLSQFEAGDEHDPPPGADELAG